MLKDSVNAVAPLASLAQPLPLPLTLLTLALPLPPRRNQVATHPNWLETDMRLSSSGAKAATPASHAEPLQVVGASLLPGMLELPVTPASPPRPPAAAAAATGSEQQDGPSESPQER